MPLQKEPSRCWRRLSLGLAASGWVLCAYALLRMRSIGSLRGFDPPIRTMSLGPGWDDFLASPEAFAGGFPLPGIGLVSLALVLFLLALDRVKATRLAFLLLIVLSGVGLVFAAVRPDAGSNVLFARYAATPSFAIPIEPSDASLGPPRAPGRLVVFNSFGCEGCRELTPIVRRLRDRFGDHVGVVFKNFPLGKECNPALASEVQPRSCAAAWAAEAANRQGGFWRYHDRLFAGSLAHSEEALRAAAVAAGLDLEQWEQDRQSPAVRLKVLGDVQLGLQLGVAGTPTVFLNGRKVENPSVVVLTTLIRQESKAARAPSGRPLSKERGAGIRLVVSLVTHRPDANEAALLEMDEFATNRAGRAACAADHFGHLEASLGYPNSRLRTRCLVFESSASASPPVPPAAG